ncbi:hypothetical protein ACF1GW_19890 [Streptomyces achromogenes]|uniref:hypothetical protein n=1 Tax=Streptomyces achromogenes TaxID=67255 RepID=UPI0036FADC7C
MGDLEHAGAALPPEAGRPAATGALTHQQARDRVRQRPLRLPGQALHRALVLGAPLVQQARGRRPAAAPDATNAERPAC